MNKKRLMIDMDDVICNNGLLRMINEYTGKNYSYDDFGDYYMQDVLDNKEEFFEWFKKKNIYDYCDMLPGCYEVMKELNEEYDLFIGTSYIWRDIANESGFILGYKHDYLRDKLPFISPHQYIFLSNKSVLDVDIKIDDRIDNLSGASIKLLFSAYHNLNCSSSELDEMGVERVNNWYEVRDRLLKNK
jgi:5'(3')-deoxyribonucleotidase